MNQQTGKYLLMAGLILACVGLLVYCFANKLTWLGRLPGDIRVEKGNFRFYFPITTMLLLSLLITVILNIIRRL